jgi:ABC-2 type transport system permease protein
LRPVSDLFFLSLREFAFNSFVNLLIAIGIAFYFIGTAPVPFDIWHIALYFLLLLNGAYLHLLLRFITVIPVFWTHSGRGLEMIFWTAERFAERPDAIYKGWTRYLLMTVIPFVALCSFPARALFGENTLQVTVYCLAISLIFTFIVRVLWKLGLKNYSSASS